ncbi:MAG: glycosyltransferase [Actinomycetota bacterium]
MVNPQEVNAASLQAAHERWDAFRAEIWLVTADARGERSRSAVLKLLRPGSAAFRLVTSAIGPILQGLRRLGIRSTVARPTSPENFPDHFSADESGGFSSHTDTPLVMEIPATSDTKAWNALEDELARAETHVVLVLPGASLQPGAASLLLETARATGADLTFGDHLERSDQGVFGVFRPPMLGPVGLLGWDAVGPVVCIRRSVINELALFDRSLPAMALHDLAAQLLNGGGTVHRAQGQLAVAPPRRPAALAQNVAWTEKSLSALGFEARVVIGPHGSISWTAKTHGDLPKVAVVIPTRDRLDLLQQCLDSLRKSTYPNYEVIIVDNDSVESATLSFLATCGHQVVHAPGPFNYSRIVNTGVAATKSSFVVTWPAIGSSEAAPPSGPASAGGGGTAAGALAEAAGIGAAAEAEAWAEAEGLPASASGALLEQARRGTRSAAAATSGGRRNTGAS